ncbi:MAG: GLPGLI family protein [Bacteroidales bacterium]|nr:GLPGLI family protein [Bacteroidales bacterium]
MIYFLLFLLIPILGFSQKKLDNAYLKCQYEYIWKQDTLSGKTRDDLLILQVGENLSKCYSYYSNEVDSIMALPNGDELWTQIFEAELKKKGVAARNFPRKRMRTYVYKNYPSGKMTVTDGVSLQDFIYEDELNAQQWEIKDSTKTILDYPCQMAACNFRGREWTAWFTTDIPVSDGPWKFGGLPGLIMEAYDKGNQYVFTIVGLQKLESEPIIFRESYLPAKRFEKTNRLDFLKANKASLMDLNGYFEMETGIDLSEGNPPKIMRYDLLELDYK